MLNQVQPTINHQALRASNHEFADIFKWDADVSFCWCRACPTHKKRRQTDLPRNISVLWSQQTCFSHCEHTHCRSWNIREAAQKQRHWMVCVESCTVCCLWKKSFKNTLIKQSDLLSPCHFAERNDSLSCRCPRTPSRASCHEQRLEEREKPSVFFRFLCQRAQHSLRKSWNISLLPQTSVLNRACDNDSENTKNRNAYNCL